MSNHKLEDFDLGDWCLVEESCWYEEAWGEVVKEEQDKHHPINEMKI